jgi:hypothetical protein
MSFPSNPRGTVALPLGLLLDEDQESRRCRGRGAREPTGNQRDSADMVVFPGHCDLMRLALTSGFAFPRM